MYTLDLEKTEKSEIKLLTSIGSQKKQENSRNNIYFCFTDYTKAFDFFEEEEMTDDEMVGWHHQLNGHEFEQTPGDGEGQGSLVCGSPRGGKELDMT